MYLNAVYFRTICQIYFLSWSAIITNSGMTSPNWCPTPHGDVAAFGPAQKYDEARMFCEYKLRASFFPISHLSDIKKKFGCRFDISVRYWVKGNRQNDTCMALRFKGFNDGWIPMTYDCRKPLQFLCEEPSQKTTKTKSTFKFSTTPWTSVITVISLKTTSLTQWTSTNTSASLNTSSGNSSSPLTPVNTRTSRNTSSEFSAPPRTVAYTRTSLNTSAVISTTPCTPANTNTSLIASSGISAPPWALANTKTSLNTSAGMSTAPQSTSNTSASLNMSSGISTPPWTTGVSVKPWQAVTGQISLNTLSAMFATRPSAASVTTPSAAVSGSTSLNASSLISTRGWITTAFTTSLNTPSINPTTNWITLRNMAYTISIHRCTFTGANQCCRQIGAKLSTTLDNSALRQVTNGLPKNGHDGKFWINGTSCFIAQRARCDILAIINGTYTYSTADANEIHFCLCQRQTLRLLCKEFDQVWKPIGAMEYLKSGKSRTYKKAEEMCTKFGGNLLNVSKVQASLLDTLELRNVEGVFWIKDTYGVSFVNPSFALTHCVAFKVNKKVYSKINTSCTEFLYSICERPLIVTSTIMKTLAPTDSTFKTSEASGAFLQFTGPTPNPVWVRSKRHEYYVTDDHMTYSEAETYCQDDLNSTLAFFTMATMYFKLPQILNMFPAKYWIGAGLEPASPDSCLAMHVQDQNSSFLFSESCINYHRSICRRPVENATLAFDEDFLKMLEELAEPSKATRSRMRKRTSATDDRKSAKAVGVLGMTVIILVSLILISFDVSHFKGCRKRRLRRTSCSTA